MKKVFVILAFFLTASIFAALFPYPIFSKYTNISKNEAFLINNFHETEIKRTGSGSLQILNLKFEEISALLPINSIFEVFDIKTGQSFFAERIGGNSHFDIEPIDDANFKIVIQIATQNNSEKNFWTWTRQPVLVKLNDASFLPASIAYYPHGYVSRSTNGHFCLHFLGSKTDGANKVDDFHQKCVAFAKRNGKEFIEKNIG